MYYLENLKKIVSLLLNDIIIQTKNQKENILYLSNHDLKQILSF